MALLVSLTRRGSVIDRLKQIFARSNDLTPLMEPARRILWEANRDRAEKGLDWQGRPYEPLAPATLADRARHYYPPGPPLNRRGSSARIITGCVISPLIARGKVTFTKSWPGVDWMEFHIRGNEHLPVRDPMGWGSELEAVRKMIPSHLLGNRFPDIRF